ncbi:substrate-binding domain-containing protein [Mycobacterium sp. AT1]|uniref:substrate-binding domain-containing protein n=1 Tax=Mycobacterium sp. AT1 TaxID=1961706 RepID=UPI0009AE3E78|nr:substrate-binding domain-containing protein [Mycobacterium sp. AT1]OPX05201.1 hypothetical protein B1790_33050 [Mycobacterium sp. AT1]
MDLATLKRMARKVFNPDLDVAQLAPELQTALMAGSVPLDDHQRKIFDTCMTSSSCETGQGRYTLAILSDLVHPFSAIARAEMVSFAIKSGEIANITYSNSGPDVQRHMTDWRIAIARGDDLIGPQFSAVGNQLGPVITQAKAAGIPVVNGAVQLDPVVAERLTVNIHFDLCGMWESAAPILKQHLTERGVHDLTYAMFTGVPGNVYAPTWQPCAEKSLDAAGFTKVYDGTTNWTPQGTVEAAGQLRASGKKPALIAYDESAADFINAYTAAGDHAIPTLMLSGSTTLGTLKAYQQAKQDGFDPDVFMMPGSHWLYGAALATSLEIKDGKQPSSRTIEYPMGIVNAADVMAQSDLSLPDVAINGTLVDSQDQTEALAN